MDATPQDLKRCCSCKQLIPRTDFYRSKTALDGLRSDCRKCVYRAVKKSLKKRVEEGRNKPPPEKKCPACGQIVPLSGWCRNRSKPDGLQHRCKECHQKANAAGFLRRRDKDPEWYQRMLVRNQGRQLQRKLDEFGLDLETYEELVEAGCVICGKLPNGRGRYGLDHCHKTGKFRGLLCSSCNLGLGYFQDDPALLARAIEYLNQHHTEG